MQYPLTHRYDLSADAGEGSLLGEMRGVLYDTCYLAFPAMVFDALPFMDAEFRAKVYDPFETVKDVMEALKDEGIYDFWWMMDDDSFEHSVNIHGVTFSMNKVSS